MPRLKKSTDANGTVFYPITISKGVYDTDRNQRLSDTLAGMVAGPVSSTNGNLAVFNGTGGKTVSDSGFSVDSFPVVVTLAQAPGTSTLTYTINGVSKNFKVGDEARVANNNSDTGYVYYKLYDISNNSASWDLIGSGDSSTTILAPTYDPQTETLIFPESMASYDSATQTITINI